MRKFLLLTVMCLFGLFTVNAQETILVGDGADESTWASAYNTPIDVYNSYYMSQQIYTAEEITSAGGAAGNITHIAFRRAENSGVPTRDWSIYLTNITESEFSGTTFLVSASDKMYSGSFNICEEWNTFELSDFAYTGGNLLVTVVDNTGTCGGDVFWYGHASNLAIASGGSQFNPESTTVEMPAGFTNRNYIQLTFGPADENGGEVEPEPTPDPEEPEDETPENLLVVETGADQNPTANGNFYLPVYDFSRYAMSQQIYTSEELDGTYGKIYSIAFKLGNQTPAITRKYEVYLTSTELDAFEGGYIALTEDDKVFDGEVEIEGTMDSWYTINLDKPFDYTSGNLLVTVYDKTGEGCGNSGYHIFYRYPATGRALYNQGYSEYDMLNLPSGVALTYVSQIQLGMSVDPALNVSSETVALGDVRLGNYWSEEVKSANVNVTAISTSVTSITCDNSFFTLNYDLTTNPVVLNVSYDKTAQVSEAQTATITIKANDVEDITVAVSANPYTPATADVYELAQEITFVGKEYTNTPAFANLNDDYKLPKEVNAGNTPDAVYSFELQDDATVTVNVTGTNAIAAIYNEDFNGEGGPKAKNHNKGIVDGPEGPTTFFFDFNDQSIEAFNLLDANNDGYNWDLASNAVNNQTWGIGSYSYVFTGVSYANVTPDNYIYTKDVYSITDESKLTFIVKSNGYADKYAVVVSEDGETFENVYEETYSSQTPKTVEVNLSEYADKALYIGFRHFDCTGQYAIFVDDVKLTDGSVETRGTDPQISAVYPAGKYYLVAAAEDAFSVDVTLSAAPTSAPETLTATTIDETTIALAWEAVENAESYNIYKDEELLTTVAADVTTYTVENLESNTVYCFTMTAVVDGVESFESNTVCAKTNDYAITAPTNVIVTALDAFSVELTWDAVEYAQRYNIYIGGEFVKSLTGNGYLLEDLTPSTEYCFEVSAVRNDYETEKVEACGSTAAIDFNDENLPTEFYFDFNDQLLDEFTLVDADGDGNGWSASSTANGYDNTFAIRSYSYWYAPLTPNNYIYTKRPYRITETSVVKLNAKCGLGMNTDLGEHYAVVVSEDGENWDIVFEETIEHAEWTNTEVSLAEYAGKGVLVGILHYNCTGLYFLAVDNFALETLEVPAAPVVTATAVNSSTISLTWAAVEGATSYNVYQGDEVIATVEETTYAVTGLTPETNYCFNVTAIGENGESAKSADACATTLEAGEEPIVPTVPAAPVLSGEATGPYEIMLTWTEVEGATGYNLYYGDQLLGAAEGTGAKISVDEAGAEYCFTVTAFNEAGESEHSNEVCVTTHPDGVEENEATFNIYPNPVSDNLVIETEANIEAVTIYTVTGVVVYNEVEFSNNTINVSDFANGVYIMKVRTENGEAVQRFIKK